MRAGDGPSVRPLLAPRPGEMLFHVEPDGRIPSLAAARDAVREMRAARGRARSVRAIVHGGTYFLSEPLVLGPGDSGTSAAPVIYTAAPGETVVVSGGERLAGWVKGERDGRTVWTLDIPAARETGRTFSSLFVAGEPRPRTRLPREGVFRFAEVPQEQGDWARFRPGDMRRWRNLSDVEVVALHYWVESRLPVASVDEESCRAAFAKKSAFWFADETKTGSCRYWIENVLEALDTPGQWYLDRAAGVLHYLPMAGEEPGGVETVAPRLDALLRFEGEEGNPVSHVHVAGLRLSHTEWSYPAGASGSAQASCDVPGAVSFRYAEECSLRLNEIRDVSTYAVEIGEGCRGIAVVANRLCALGAGGVKIEAGSSRSVISDNTVADGGRRYASAVGILVRDSGDNIVSHNEIRDFFYSGVSAGWIWSYDPESRARRNIIAHNHIHGIGQGMLSDLGGIYLLGVSPGTLLEGNLIHDVECFRYNGNGIYLDAGVVGTTVEGNVVRTCNSHALYNSNGRDNLVRNNVLHGVGADAPVAWATPPVFRPWRIERNVIVTGDGPAVDGPWDADAPNVEFDRNLYRRTDGGEPEFGGAGWEGWRRRGLDEGSLVGDPLFAAEDRGDLSLRPGSPAFGLGFEPIDLSSVGPRPDVLRTGETGSPAVRHGPIVWSYIATPRASAAMVSDLAGRMGQPARPPCQIRVEAVCENAGDEPFAGEVALVAWCPGGPEPLASARGSLLLEPSARASVGLDADVPAGAAQIVCETRSPAAGFIPGRISLGFRSTAEAAVLPPKIPVGELAAALAAAPAYPVVKGDAVLGTFRIGTAGDRLAVAVSVNDCRVEVPEPVTKGSMVDLFGLDAAGEMGQVFLLPASPGGPARATDINGRELPGTEVLFTPTPGGYEMAALVPLAALRIDADAEEFSFRGAVYTHLPGSSGVVRTGLFSQRSIPDPLAFGLWSRRAHG